MAGKRIVLLTGANSGIGFAAAKALWSSSVAYHILFSGRSKERVETALKELQSSPSPGGSSAEALLIDITSDESIAAAAQAVEEGHGRVDAVVNNAGGTADVGVSHGAANVRDALNRGFDLNVASTHVLTDAFAPLLLRSDDPRLLFLTSGLASLAEEHDHTTPGEARMVKAPAGWPKPERSRGFPGYRMAKAAVNMMFLVWRRQLEADGVKCFSISPGFLATNLVGTSQEAMKAQGAGDASIGGNFIRDVIEGKRDADEGKVIRTSSIQPW